MSHVDVETEIVAKSLHPAKVLSVNADGRKLVVRIAPSQKKKLMGSGERILRITERLVKKTIKLETRKSV